MAAKKLLRLMDPASPGMLVWVMRGWWGQRFYPKHFATLGETLAYRELNQAMEKRSSCYCKTKWIRNPNGVVIT